MADPQMVERALGGDGRVYVVSTIRLDQKPRGAMWETIVWESGGCLTMWKRNVRYIEYTLPSPQTAGGLAAEAHQSALQLVTTAEEQDWHMAPQEIEEQKQAALRLYNSFPFV